MKNFTLFLVSLLLMILTVNSQTVNLIENPYANVNWSTYNQYKANYHTHTTNSDGSQSPSEVINEYYSKGYTILTITDHNVTTWPWPNNPGMLAVKGNEYSTSHHMNAMINFTNSSSNLENGIPHVQANGGIVQINHPGRYNSPSNWSWYIPWFRDYSSCVTLEVFNQGDRYSSDRQLWDNINENYFAQEGEFVWGTSNDDKHNTSHLYGNFNFMLMPDLTEASFVESMSNGAFYFCYEPGRSGDANVPRISNIVVDDNTKTISITATGYSSIQWIGQGTSVVATGNVFDYSAYTNQYFVRAVLDGPNGDSYTQPFGFETIIVTNPPTCSITSPADGAIFTAPASVTINADAADSDGTIAMVEFFEGSTKLGEDLSSPYSYTWSDVAAGTYILTVKATDDGGALTTSSAVAITVNGAGGTPIAVSKRIASSNDDVEESQSTGVVYTNSTDIELVYDSYNSQNNQTVGLRYTGLNIPQGATIISASINFTVDEASSGVCNLLINGHDADNSEVFTTAINDVSSRPTTAASINWSPADWAVVGETWTSPDISGIIQEIVNRTGYSLSSAISIIITGTGTRIADAYDDAPGSAALLQIEYTMANNAPPVFISDPFSKDNATVDQPYSGSIAGDASDPDGDNLYFHKVSGPAWLSIATNGDLSGTPTNSDLGTNNWVVEVNDGNGGTDNASLEIDVTDGSITYCNSHGFAVNEWIDRITIGDESYQSGSSGETGYQDLSGAFTFSFLAGSDNNLTGIPGFSPRSKFEYWKIWIDFNNDGDFVDDGELVFTANKKKSNVVGIITIPDMPSVETTMRVSMKRGASPTSCEIFAQGEVEDYAVTITNAGAQPPVADFDADNTTIYEGGMVQFTDLSTNAPDTWSWTFGNGETSGDQNPSLTYNNAGSYTVSLTVTNGNGQDTETKGDYINVLVLPAAPIADFSADINSILTGESVQFTDQSTGGIATSWLWNFGDNASSTSQNPSHTYNTAGVYTVSLTATNAGGTSVETKTDFITVGVNTSYCTSSSSSNAYDWIWGVEIGNYANLANGVNMYSDFTGEEIELTPGATVNVVLTPGFTNKSQREYWSIWIDYNGNADFNDSGEQVFVANNKKSAVSGSFTLPSQLSGQTRMRISMKNGSAPLSCGTFTYGEVEDYTVVFGSTTKGAEAVMGVGSDNDIAEKSVSVYPNPVKDKLNIQFYQWTGEKEIKLYDMTGKPVYLRKTSDDYLQVDVSLIKNGIYLLIVNDDKTIERKKILIQ